MWFFLTPSWSFSSLFFSFFSFFSPFIPIPSPLPCPHQYLCKVFCPPLSPSPSWGVIDSPSVHLSWKRRRRQRDVIHLAGDGGSAVSLITGPINLTHRGRISAAVSRQTHMACLHAEDFLLYLEHSAGIWLQLRPTVLRHFYVQHVGKVKVVCKKNKTKTC